MRLDGLHIQNFRSYGDVEIDFSGLGPLAAVVGENGAGKSSIMDAGLFALTSAGKRGLNLDDWIRDGQEECRVSETFAIGGEVYRATRTRSRRNSGKSTAELCRLVDGLWVAESTGATETDVRIKQILGADEDLLCMTSFIIQDEAKAFLELTPSKRLEALAKILRLDEQYGPVEKHFKAKVDAAKADLDEARRETARLENDAAALVDRETALISARDELAEKQAALREAEEALSAARDAARAAEREAEVAKGAGERLSELQAKRTDLQRRMGPHAQLLSRPLPDAAALEAQLATKPDVEAAIGALEAAERADAETRQKRSVLDAQLHSQRELLKGVNAQGVPKKAEADRLQTARSDLSGRIVAIEAAEVPTCDRCGQAIADAAKERTLTQLRGELGGATERFVALSNELESLRDTASTYVGTIKAIEEDLSALPPLTYDYPEHKRLKDALYNLEGIPAQLAEIAGQKAMREQAQADLAEITRQLEDPAFLAEVAKAEAAVAEAEGKTAIARALQRDEQTAEYTWKQRLSDVSEVERTIAGHESAIALLAPSRDRLQEVTKQAHALETEQADADLLRKAFSKNGIPALIIGNVLLALEKEVNELMALYEGGMTVRFASTKETRDGTRDSLEIIIDREGSSREYATYSGGEKYRIASCIRLGLALLMAHRAGSRISTLIMDEPEGLDAPGREHLVAILNHLSGQFERILLISHHDDLKDAMPSRVLVTRGNDGLSRVEVAA